MITAAQLRWAGHLVRMSDNRLPKRLFYGELATGNRPQHKPRKRYKDGLKIILKDMDIDHNTGGQVLVMPGTHKGGAISVGDTNEDFTGQVVLTPKKGTLVLIHGHLWHRVLPINNLHRVSTNYRCCPANTPDNITDTCVYRNMRYAFSSNQVIEDRTV